MTLTTFVSMDLNRLACMAYHGMAWHTYEAGHAILNFFTDDSFAGVHGRQQLAEEASQDIPGTANNTQETISAVQLVHISGMQGNIRFSNGLGDPAVGASGAVGVVPKSTRRRGPVPGESTTWSVRAPRPRHIPVQKDHDFPRIFDSRRASKMIDKTKGFGSGVCRSTR